MEDNKNTTLVTIAIAILMLIIVTGAIYGAYKIGHRVGQEVGKESDTNTEQQANYPKEIILSKKEEENLTEKLINKLDEGFYFSKSMFSNEEENDVYKDMKTLDEEDMLVFALLLTEDTDKKTMISKNDSYIGIQDYGINVEEDVFETSDSISAKIEKYFGKKDIDYTKLDLEKLMECGAMYNETQKAFRHYSEYGGAGIEYKFVKLEQLDENNNYVLYVDRYIDADELSKDRAEKFLVKKIEDNSGSRYVIEGRQITKEY